jgi:sorbitol-specific phosphotransferase system component IIC
VRIFLLMPRKRNVLLPPQGEVYYLHFPMNFSLGLFFVESTARGYSDAATFT